MMKQKCSRCQSPNFVRTEMARVIKCSSCLTMQKKKSNQELRDENTGV